MKKVISAAAMVVVLTGCNITDNTDDMLVSNNALEQNTSATEVVCRRVQRSGSLRHEDVCEPKGGRQGADNINIYGPLGQPTTHVSATEHRWVEGYN